MKLRSHMQIVKEFRTLCGLFVAVFRIQRGLVARGNDADVSTGWIGRRRLAV